MGGPSLPPLQRRGMHRRAVTEHHGMMPRLLPADFCYVPPLLTRDTPVEQPILVIWSCASLSLYSAKMLSHSSLPPMALTVPATPRRAHQCRRHRCPWDGGDVTSRCRTTEPGDASGTSALYLGGQINANPRVSNPTTLGQAGELSRSRPSDSQLSTWSCLSPASSCLVSGMLAADKVRARFDSRRFVYGTTYITSLTPMMSSRLWFPKKKLLVVQSLGGITRLQFPVVGVSERRL